MIAAPEDRAEIVGRRTAQQEGKLTAYYPDVPVRHLIAKN